MTPVLLIETPGTPAEAWAPLTRQLARLGPVTAVRFPCTGELDALYAGLRDAAPDGEYALVAHGLGATLALQAGLTPARSVLLGPVLAPPVDDAALAAALAVTGPGCVPPALAQAGAAWLDAGVIPLEPGLPGRLTVISAPLDELAPVEVLIHAARALGADVVRVGLGRLGASDPDHAALIADPPAGLRRWLR